jgi:predicted transcriptional regulator
LENNELLEKLFFELASESRLRILQELQTEDLKMNEVARRLDVTATEAFRQLQRLSEAKLVQKQPEGTFNVTGYGKLVLQLSSAYKFVSKQREYFLTHDVWSIPVQFINRLGELSNADLILDAMDNINKGEKMFIAAKQHAWGIAEGRIPELMNPIMDEKVKKGLKIKMIIEEKLLAKVAPIKMSNVEVRGIKQIPFILASTENAATVCFRFKDGRLDYGGFYGNDPSFVNWVNDLFLYYWQKAKII